MLDSYFPVSQIYEVQEVPSPLCSDDTYSTRSLPCKKKSFFQKKNPLVSQQISIAPDIFLNAGNSMVNKTDKDRNLMGLTF